MGHRKKAVLGIVLFLLTVFVVYSCIVVFGARSREPERAKLVTGWVQQGGIEPANGR
jgi:threonine/homoserine/homoserine lactone efflux protein